MQEDNRIAGAYVDVGHTSPEHKGVLLVREAWQWVAEVACGDGSCHENKVGEKKGEKNMVY